MPTEEQCQLHRDSINKKQEEITNRLCDKMDKMLTAMSKLGGELIENNTNTNYILNRQVEQINRTNEHDKEIAYLKQAKAGVYAGLAVANVVMPLLFALLGYIYTKDLMTEAKVRVIVVETIESNYTQND